jgi:ribosomal protein S18 acetylase RimI-like enzyme
MSDHQRTSDIVLRDARDDERDAIRSLTLHANAEYGAVMEPSAYAALDRALNAALASTPAGVERIVADRGGVLVGSVMLYPPAEDAYGGLVKAASWPELRLLAVAPGARGLGIARMLVDECIRRAKRQGATELGLHTSKSMIAAVKLYQSLGFARVPDHDFQPEGAELVEAYRLSLDN